MVVAAVVVLLITAVVAMAMTVIATITRRLPIWHSPSQTALHLCGPSLKSTPVHACFVFYGEADFGVPVNFAPDRFAARRSRKRRV